MSKHQPIPPRCSALFNEVQCREPAGHEGMHNFPTLGERNPRPRMGSRVARGLSTVLAVAENAWTCSVDSKGRPDGDWEEANPEDVQAAFSYMTALIRWHERNQRT